MCIECGCESVGSETGIASVSIQDVTFQGTSGVTLSMVSTPEQTERFINE
jgi:hypothetical protein